MPRKRIELGPSADAMIRALLARGGTVESITAALRAGPAPEASTSTVGRRMAEVRPAVNGGRSARRKAAGAAAVAAVAVEAVAPPAGEPDLPRSPDEIPEGTGLEAYDRELARAERMADGAELEGDLKATGNAGRLVGFLLDAKRKATPKPVADPNAAPDMVALGAEVEARFLKMVDLVLEEM